MSAFSTRRPFFERLKIGLEEGIQYWQGKIQLRATDMTSTIGGNDPLHGLNDEEKDKEEKKLRAGSEEQKKPKERNKLNNRAYEISREKSKRAQHH